MRVLFEAERRAFLAALGTLPRHRARRRACFYVLYDTGARVSEVVGLDVVDFDRNRSSVLLANVKAAGQPRREVPLHPRTVRALGVWLRERPGSPSPALFVSQKGSRLSVRQLQADYDLVCRIAGITPTGIHTLRHTAASRLLDDRILDVHQVARRLGHRQITTTLRYYVHGSVEAEARRIRASAL